MGTIRIFTPAAELDFAGHPTVGTAWLLARERAPVPALDPPAGEVAVRYSGDETFVAGRAEWGPQYEFRQLGSRGGGRTPSPHRRATTTWSSHGPSSTRTPASSACGCSRVAIGIAEDEATGSAAVQLGSPARPRARRYDRARAPGSVARPLGDGRVEIGGRSVLDDVRDHPVL